ncbi:TRAP transporter small permease [Paramagnetospirillum magneticum]|uniref:TRAP transporter small permease protein n=1 Tax=Paramagnetospirillum magneticum (strain ATCC 700264 / AMB-1) TaxID=342108 RepID=Q2W8X7_PARM1|nr:TRAP transporter small permease [Paramagnetospirillum magneticum]BAE49698.1 TRAP-type C4-dicarboxylate transport system [Paramagnetospirillum magneticum AMB-1]
MLRALDHLEEWLIAFLMGTATLIIFVAVLQRYAAGTALLYPLVGHLDFSWAQELCIIMFVWMAKFGAAYGVRTGIHVGVDVVINRLDPQWRAKLIVFGLLAGALFTGIVATMGGHFVMENGAHYAFLHAFGLPTGDLYEGPITPDMEAPTWVVYSAIPLGSALMCFRFLQVCVGFIRTGELPHHDHGHVEGLEEDTTDPQRAAQDINWFEMSDNLHPKDAKDDKGDHQGEKRP